MYSVGLGVTAAQNLTNSNCADVVAADASRNPSTNLWTVAATISSPYETGWDQYANEFRVMDMEESILATRELLHPHENEQPFTRSVGNVEIPSSLLEIVVQAKDLINGYCGKEFVLQLEQEEEETISETLTPTESPVLNLNPNPASQVNAATSSPVSTAVSTMPENDSGIKDTTQPQPPQNQLLDTLSPVVAPTVISSYASRKSCLCTIGVVLHGVLLLL